MRDSVWRRSVTSSWVLIRYCGLPVSSSTVMRRVRNSRSPSLVLIGCSSVSRPRFLIAASSRAMISFASLGLKISAAVKPVASSRRRLRMASALRLARRYRPSLTRSTISETGMLSTTSSRNFLVSSSSLESDWRSVTSSNSAIRNSGCLLSSRTITRVLARTRFFEPRWTTISFLNWPSDELSADRNIVEHRFQELLGRGQLSRQLALLAAILVCRHRTAVWQCKVFDQNRPSAGQLGDEAFRRAGVHIEIVDADVEDAALELQRQQFRPGHVFGKVRTRQAVDLEIAVVAEHDPASRIRHHHTMTEVVQRGTDKGIPAQLRALDLAQRREHPQRDGRKKRRDGDAGNQHLPNRIGVG